MNTVVSTVISVLAFRFRRRASLEFDLIGPRIKWPSHAAASRLDSPVLHGPASVGLALPILAARPQRHCVGQVGNRGPLASQGLSGCETLGQIITRASPPWYHRDHEKASGKIAAAVVIFHRL
jgi:hypothetical protein